MTLDSESTETNPTNAPSAPSLESSPPLNEAVVPQAANPFIPKLGLRELRATWEMLTKFGRAIKENEHWSGKDVEAVAMGLTMIKQMGAQYHVQVEIAQREAESEKQRIKKQIKAQGGKIYGNGSNHTDA